MKLVKAYINCNYTFGLVLGMSAFLCLSCNTSTQSKRQNQIRSTENIYQLKELSTITISSFNKDKTIIIIPGGIIEEHGPYLPSFTDGYWNEKFSDTLSKTMAKRKGWNVVIFPTIPLGNSGANDVGSKYSFPGTYTVRFETLRSIFMDLATEFGEQGFKYIFIIHAHGAPSHNRALDQAAKFFNDTYGGKMVNLMGLNPLINSWFQTTKTKEQEQEDGYTIHAGVAETSSMLFLRPQLVNQGYKMSQSFTASNMEHLIDIAKSPQWQGYFGAERLATVQFGEKAWNENVAMFTKYAMDILDGKMDPDTIPRFGDIMKESPADIILDRLSAQEEHRRKQKQEAWLNKSK